MEVEDNVFAFKDSICPARSLSSFASVFSSHLFKHRCFVSSCASIIQLDKYGRLFTLGMPDPPLLAFSVCLAPAPYCFSKLDLD